MLKHLTRSYPAAVREEIARALAVPDAKTGWDLFVRFYKEEQEPRVKDGLAAAISAMADDLVIHDVISLARDRQQGPSRVLLLSALARSTDSQARASLMDLQHDDELKKEVERILRKLKPRSAEVRPFGGSRPLMSVHNIIHAPVRCPHCHRVSHSEIEGFVGFGNLDHYRIGDRIAWLPRKSVQHGGRPPNGDIDAEGYTVCEHCGRDFFVRLRVRGDTLVEVEANPDKRGYM